MRLKLLSISAATIALAWSVQYAQAGAIRSAGNAVGKGSIAVAQVTADAAGTAAGGVADASKATGPVLKDGVVTAGKAAVWAPTKVAQGTGAAVSKLVHIAW